MIKQTLLTIVFLTYLKIKQRYLNSILGPLWLLLYPLLSTVIYVVIFAQFFDQSYPYYTWYVALGVIQWGFFSQSLVHLSSALTDNRELLKNSHFKPLIFILTYAFEKWVDFTVTILLFLVIFTLSVGLQPTLIITSLVTLGLQFLFQLGLGSLLALLHVWMTDLKYMLLLSFQLLFYATPIIYPEQIVPQRFLFWLRLNPAYWFLKLGRDQLTTSQLDPGLMLMLVLGGGVMLIISGLCFRALQRRVIDYL